MRTTHISVYPVPVPPAAIERSGFAVTHYCDAYAVQLPLRSDLTVTQFADYVNGSIPGWVSILMRVRNGIVKRFGLKTGDPTGTQSLNIFEALNPIELTTFDALLGDDDKHLNFRVLLTLCADETKTVVTMSTVVHFNNVFGRIYFIPVKPFHRCIVKAILRRAAIAIMADTSFPDAC